MERQKANMPISSDVDLLAVSLLSHFPQEIHSNCRRNKYYIYDSDCFWNGKRNAVTVRELQ